MLASTLWTAFCFLLAAGAFVLLCVWIARLLLKVRR
jgi:hypothetical protein